MTVQTALGDSDEPAQLRGYGPITAEHARELLGNAVLRQVSLDQHGRVVAVAGSTVRITSREQLPEALTAMRTTAVPPAGDENEPGYSPSARLRRLVTRAYPTCAFPTCSVPASRCDLDHKIPWPHGPTHPGNLQPLSRRHHRAKQAGWTPRPQPDGSTTWTSPCGRRYRTPAPWS